MLTALFVFSLIGATLNWLLFIFITFAKDLPALKEIAELMKGKGNSSETGLGNVHAQSAVDPTKIAAATGSLAGAFKKAGPAPTAAAMAVLCLLVAAIAAGINKF